MNNLSKFLCLSFCLLMLVCVFTACDSVENSEVPSSKNNETRATDGGSQENQPHEHSFGDWTTIKEATCTEDGSKQRGCSFCSETETEEILASHDEIQHNAKSPTCTEIGWNAYVTCLRCDYTTYTETKPALGHDEVKHEAKVANCIQKGWDAYITCSRCNYSTYAEKAALGHTVVIDEAVAPTCTTSGLTEGKHCSICNNTLIEQEKISPLSHEWTTTYEYDKDVHWKKCRCCDATTAKVAHNLGANGYCRTCNNPIAGSEGVVYLLSSDGTYAEVIDYSGTFSRIVIAEEYEGVPVTKISSKAFEGKKITSIAIPSSVTSIGNDAFYDCDALTSITIPNSVTSIGSSAFSGCSSLTSITIPNSVMSIGSSAFSGCRNVIETINGVSYVGNVLIAFDNSAALVSIREGTTIIANSAFSGASKLRVVTIPDSVTSIGECAFAYCSSLTSVTIPDSVTSIGSYAFLDCRSLTSITIPDSVTSIGYAAFKYCRSLTDIYFTGTKAEWNAIDKFWANIPSSATIHFNYVPSES